SRGGGAPRRRGARRALRPALAHPSSRRRHGPRPHAVRRIFRGKVREVYDVGNRRLLVVATDRISAYDVVLPTAIPDKGRVLTALTAHWCAVTADIVPNHLVSVRPDDLPEEARGSDFNSRSMLVDRLRMLPVECVVRGWLAGSAWREYGRTG